MQNAQWRLLQIHHRLANTDDDIDRNIRSVLGRAYLSYQELVQSQSGAVSIVGSGPSLKANWTQLRDSGMDIIACNAACQFLLERGVVPKYMMCFDADPLMLEFLTPHPEITYLLASRCPPAAFEAVKGCRVVVWHAAGDTNLERLLQEAGKFNEPMVIGGTAAVTRAMVLAQTLGYTQVHLWGADSSFIDGDTHIRKSTTEERRMMVSLGGRVFTTAPWMTQQVEDFKILGPQLRDRCGVTFHVHGDGLIPQVAASMGFKVDAALARKQFIRDLKWKARTLWQTL